MGEPATDGDVADLKVTAVSCGSSHTLALLSEFVHPIALFRDCAFCRFLREPSCQCSGSAVTCMIVALKKSYMSKPYNSCLLRWSARAEVLGLPPAP